MEPVLILILLCIALDIAAWHWGFDSTEQIDSPEWERRWIWAASFRQDDENHVTR
jgi:hypothetical protein